ncbi:(Fe-S)-binding protein [Phototrophicus methaneseepsis]|uniref:(Fe-S)-binding protein n=1 Tax=Phototrophicus methaneseepsis TaxID=2710758 RepID=A0A7S8E811_9CHLR|nr:(Fe-S)-binding protein [Phototrophicus methaneseepsis]QPC81998.1 (Fe-S)-binding protein [Phototrophicus methaneseepsis]
MLSPIEKLLFILLALFSIGATYAGLRDMYAVIQRGEGKLHFSGILGRAWKALRIYITQETTLKTRRFVSLIHWGVVLGFTYYILVNIIDVLAGLFEEVEQALENLDGFGLAVYDAYRLMGDVLSVVVLVGVAYFILRRLVLPNKDDLTYHDNILLHPKVAHGSQLTDSMIVAIFILLHVGARFLGESVIIAGSEGDVFMPFATLVSPIFGSDAAANEGLRHLLWWVAIGGILLFTPYFPYTKHAHLFMAPANFLTRPKRTSLGELRPIDFEDEDREQFGADKLEHLPMTQILDAFACIQCNRCQDVCPAYVTGKELSPSALEVNKRYYINEHMTELANGEESDWSLMGTTISESAIWACTSCAACIDICPTGNEPMMDIFDIRRNQVLMEADFPDELAAAFNGMERQGNPWGIGESRFAWADGLDVPVPTVEENPDFDILYWVGCAASYDDRAKNTARSLVKVMNAAGVNFAVLGEMENCTGDSARRGGNEYLYFELASANVETLNEVNPPRIVVTCPHCLHNLGKEYHQFGGEYEVIHHTELIEELIQAGKLPATARPGTWSNVTFHDPCYLGRHNDIVEAPRNALSSLGVDLIEMPRNKKNSFCCGAGGAQFWKEEEHGEQAVNLARYEEAMQTGADVVAVGCPFCMQMFESARSDKGEGPQVKDVVELIAEQMTVPAGD